MAPPLKVRKYLYKLDDIEVEARKRHSDCTFNFLRYVSDELVKHFIYVTTQHSDEVHGPLVDALYFYFNEKLRYIFLYKSELVWLSYDFVEDGLLPLDHKATAKWWAKT